MHRLATWIVVTTLALPQPLLAARADAPAAAASRAPLRVVTDDNFPPYAFVNHNGKLVGYEVDLWTLWQQKTGRKVDLVGMDWAAAQDAVRSGKADVIDLIYDTPERSATLDFSKPFAVSPASIFSSHDINGIDGVSALKGFEVGVESGDACAQQLRSDGVDSLHLYPDYRHLIDAAVRGDVKIFCMDDAPASYYLYKRGQSGTFDHDFTYYRGQLRRAVRKGNDAVLAEVGRGMARITPAERAALRKKWMGHPVDFTPYARILGIALAVALVLAALILLWVRQLRKAVGTRTSELSRRNAQLRTLIDSSPDMIWLKDVVGTYLACNRQMAEFLGHAREHVIGRKDHDLLDADVADGIRDDDVQTLDSRQVTVDESCARFPGDDQPHVLETIRAPVFDGQHQVAGLFGMSRDITHRKHAEQRLAQAAKVFESTQDGVIVTDAERRIVTVNKAFTRITGYEADEVLGSSPAQLVAQRDGKDPFLALWTAPALPEAWQGEAWSRRKSGKVFPAWWTVNAARDGNGAITHFVAVFADTGRIRHYETRIRYLTHYDLLTKLPNRELLMDRLEQAIRRAKDQHGQVAVVLLGLDNLASINDSFGHRAGDDILSVVGKRLSTVTGPKHTLAFVRGSKFAMLVEHGTDPVSLSALADRARHEIAQPIDIGDHHVQMRASVGVAVYPADGRDADSLLKNVDTAMHSARNRIKGSVSFYSEDLSAAARRALQLDQDLREALEEGQFELFYQPRWSAASGELSGVEALIRWRSPRHGMVSPDQFIPFAEDNGLIVPIGRWVLRTACAQLAQWRLRGIPDVPIAVNVSTRQFASASFIDDVKSALEASDVTPDYLELEVTEGQLLDKSQGTDRMMGEIWAMGVSLAIDDFGTGYSSLSYLRHLPAKVLKIDRSFVDDVPEDADATRIIAAIISMAHALRMTVVAEGVEHMDQVVALRELECDELQGYFRGPPMPADDFVDFVLEAQRSATGPHDTEPSVE